jgi:paraquat-inducible protein B
MSRLAEDVGSIADAIKRADLQTVIGHADRLLVSADKAVNDAKVAELQRRLDGMLGELDASARRLRAILADPKIDALLADASSTMTSVNNVVNGNDVKAAVGDLPRITGGARSAIARVDEMVRSPQLQKTLDNVHQATGTADVSLTELRRGLRSVNELFSSERGQIEQTLGSLRRTLENVEALIADLKRNPSRAIFGSPPRHLNPGERQ